MNVKTSKRGEPELHPDAWTRFERAVDVVAKTLPQPKIKGKLKTNPKGRGKPAGKKYRRGRIRGES